MVMDRNGMSHKAAGMVGGGRFERKTGARSDDDLTVDLSDATIDEYGDLVEIMRPARPGESDDRPLAYAWRLYDPFEEDSEFAIQQNLKPFARWLEAKGPLHLDSPQAREMLVKRIRQTALQPYREYKKYGLLDEARRLGYR